MPETFELLQVIRCFFSGRRDSMQNLSINPNSVNKNLAHHDSSLSLKHTFFGQIYESYSIPTKEKNNFIEKQARLL